MIGFTRDEIKKHYIDYLKLAVAYESHCDVETVTDTQIEAILDKIAYNVKKDLPFHKNGIMHLFEGSCRFHQKDQICDAA